MKKTNQIDKTDKTVKAMSWIERVKSAFHIFTPKIQRIKQTRVLTSTQVLDDTTGRVVKKTTYIPFSNKLSKFKVSDFSIENLQSVGAFDNLKSVKLSASTFSKINSVENGIQSIISKESNNQNNN